MRNVMLALLMVVGLIGCHNGANLYDPGCKTGRDSTLRVYNDAIKCAPECAIKPFPGIVSCDSDTTSTERTYNQGMMDSQKIYQPFAEAAVKCVGQERMDTCYPPEPEKD